MRRKIRKLKGGSAIKGELPKGCKLCRKGAKLFFLMTGLCDEHCFYCSLTNEKRGRELVFANERPITHFSGAMIEAANMNALGAAITGGDPLIPIDQTIEYIQKMKREFGQQFHIHLYTSGRHATEEVLKKLYEAGLDEIRFHPQNKKQRESIKQALVFDWDVGAEIPILPGKKEQTIEFFDYLQSLEGIRFCNMNELEATESNLQALKKHHYTIKNTNSSAIKGSEELALELLKETNYDFSLHYCSSKAKDAVQFRNRLKRTAMNIRKPYEEIQDGMLIKALIKKSSEKQSEQKEMIQLLIDEYEVPPTMIDYSKKHEAIITSWYIADSLQKVLFKQFKVEDILIIAEYPTYGRVTIGQTSLRELKKRKEEEKEQL
jgi:hypothetical protein